MTEYDRKAELKRRIADLERLLAEERRRGGDAFGSVRVVDLMERTLAMWRERLRELEEWPTLSVSATALDEQ